eukprot:TRINITY_DN9358_c0_g2_i1.p1 TRINITY_DN9358_c0_g2~~TRINITY_DN9358_c0_g2_i1.p1  ORF type:complete len:106 (+),score=24.54 TRINITY_DN9358_c0_g2_i1:143-460(+)
MDAIRDRFVALRSSSPQDMFEFLSDNKEFVASEQVDKLKQKIAEMKSAGDKNATSLIAKTVILQYCVEVGVDNFFDSLCSNPPDETCTRFQATMKAEISSCSHSH